MFETNPKDLTELLASVENGELQIPEFQRDWRWDDDHIRALLTSISRGFPIGAIMTLSAGDIRFKPRLVQGVNRNDTDEVDQFLLDGQQRLTALYQALKSPDVVETRDSRGRPIERWYYIDMLKAIDGTADKNDVIISVPKDKRITRNFGRDLQRDLSTTELEYENHMMPMERLLDPTGWIIDYNNYWQKQSGEHPSGDLGAFIKDMGFLTDVFKKYKIPVIKLDKETPKEAVCIIFEEVNKRGIPLNVFELVTASFAADDFSLRDDWYQRRKRLHGEFGVLQGIEGEHFLQAVALLATQQHRRDQPDQVPRISCQKHDILNLPLADYQKWADKVEVGFRQAAKFLHSQFVFKHGDVPYNTQLVPLAALYTELGHDLAPAKARERLERWYWSGIFGEVYGSAVETQSARDLVQVAEYIRAGTLPALIEQANFTPERLIALQKRISAAYKGLIAFQMKSGAADWRTGESLTLTTYHDEAIDIHHIFPVAWCNAANPPIPPYLHNSVINKAPISAVTNRIIGGAAPSRYMLRLERDNPQGNLRRVLSSHWLDYDLLARDQFAKCFIERGEKMLGLIGEAMGKDLPSGRDVFRGALVRAGLLPAEGADVPEPTGDEEFDDGDDEHDAIGTALFDTNDAA